MIGIYKIENTKNHKVYIGQALDINMRWKQHKEALKSSTKSWYPIAREESDSINDFNFQILQECSKNELDELEEYWIKIYDSYNNGYNHTQDGNVSNTRKIILSKINNYNNENILNLMKTYNGNTFKVILWLLLKSHSHDVIAYMPSIISNDTGVSLTGCRRAFTELIEHKNLQLINNEYILIL